MKVRALQTCYIDGTWRRGPEYNDNDELLDAGEVFDVADGRPINPEVLQVLDDDGKPVKPASKQPATAGAKK
jgi:hypothetical protein